MPKLEPNRIEVVNGGLRGVCDHQLSADNLELLIDGAQVEVGWSPGLSTVDDGSSKFKLRLPASAFDGKGHRFEMQDSSTGTSLGAVEADPAVLRQNRFDSSVSLKRGTVIVGWIQDASNPEDPVTVVLREGSDELRRVEATRHIPWIAEKYDNPGTCGFRIDLSAGYLGAETRRFGVFVDQPTFELSGSPVSACYRTAALNLIGTMRDENLAMRQVCWNSAVQP